MMGNDSYLVLSTSSIGYQLYDIRTHEERLCKSRRKISYNDEKIAIGDEVFVEDDFIVSIKERKNLLKRPRCANLDNVYVLMSLTHPDFSSYLLDKFLSQIAFSDIKAKIVLTKCDLLKKEELDSYKERMTYYSRLGFDVFFIDAKNSSMYDYQRLLDDLRGKRIAFVGQTGVGKSTLLNTIEPGFTRKVDSLFITSGRGRHTTKEVRLFPFDDGFLFDTPGFSALDLIGMTKRDLALCFPGYGKYFGKCMYNDCLHLPSSPGCLLKSELDVGLSHDSYDNYLRLLDEIEEEERKWKRKR